MNDDYPVRFTVEYPDRDLDRLTTAFRIFTVIPIAIVLGTIGGYSGGGGFDGGSSGTTTTIAVGGTGLLFLPPLLMIVFRQKYPRWWFDWNLELLRFTNRVGIYVALMNDRYPSTDEQQSVRLDFGYPDAQGDLNRWHRSLSMLLALGEARRVTVVSSFWHIRVPWFFAPYRAFGLDLAYRSSLAHHDWFRLLRRELREAHRAAAERRRAMAGAHLPP